MCIAEGRWGDVNNDNIVNIIDAQQMARKSVGLSVANATTTTLRGDVNATGGEPNIIDAQQTARFAVGLSAAARLGTGTFTTPAVATHNLTPSTTQAIAVGATLQITNTPRDAASADLTGCAGSTWSSSNTAVATVNASGLVTGVAVGSATITSTSTVNGAITASINVDVGGGGPPTIHVVLTHAGRPAKQYIAQVSGGALAAFQGFVLNGTNMNGGVMDLVMPGAGTYTVRVAAIDAASGVNLLFVAGGKATGIVVGANGTVNAPITLTAPTYTMTNQPSSVPINTSIVLGWTIVDPSGLIDAPERGLFCGATHSQLNTFPNDFAGTQTNACQLNIPVGGTIQYTNSNTPIAGQSTPGSLKFQVRGSNQVRQGIGAGTDVTVWWLSPSVARGETPLSITIATPVTSVTVTPASPSIPVGVQQQMVATARDASNNVVNGFPVTWSSATPAVATVSASGMVTGVANGTSVITATVTGVSGITTVTVSGGINVGSITVNPITTLNGNGTTTASAVVRDPSNNIINGAAVTWSSSNFRIARVAQDGTVQALGSGTSTITATIGAVSGSAPVTVNAMAAGYSIVIRPTTSMTPAVSAAFNNAAARWAQIIRGDEPDVVLSDFAVSGCVAGQPNITETIDDLVIYATVAPIDGVGGILGQAGPCFSRAGSGHALIGRMTFDDADMANMETNGTLTAVILHEMGHVIGIGTNWGTLLLNPAPQPGVGDPTFAGVNAQWAFGFLGTGYAGEIVPVENCCSDGTRNAHWRESVLQRELMTGFVTGGGGLNPLSPLTAASLIDLGYVVDVNQSDLPPSFLRAGASEPGMQIKEEILTSPTMIDLFGRAVRGGPTRSAIPAPMLRKQ